MGPQGKMPPRPVAAFAEVGKGEGGFVFLKTLTWMDSMLIVGREATPTDIRSTKSPSLPDSRPASSVLVSLWSGGWGPASRRRRRALVEKDSMWGSHHCGHELVSRDACCLQLQPHAWHLYVSTSAPSSPAAPLDTAAPMTVLLSPHDRNRNV